MEGLSTSNLQLAYFCLNVTSISTGSFSSFLIYGTENENSSISPISTLIKPLSHQSAPQEF